ncbi:MAG: DUF5916 domain-containing protein, partial [Candidatus Didemnitutus sp.]|nr:DUF5916 domain-containing protein [Candidatus Didemnitutus sp.]
MLSFPLRTALLVVAAPALLLPSFAQTPPPSLDVAATTTPPLIDGIISPGEWTGAAHSAAFRQVLPAEDVEPTERTEFWVTFDADFVYVAVRSHDSAGLGGVRAYSMQRDQDNGSDDLIRIVFDTFNRKNDGYYFALSAAGGKHDGLIQNQSQRNDQWDALWHGKVSRDEGGWSAEFAIPAKSIAFDSTIDTWGFTVARALRRKQEVMRWAGFSRQKPTTSLPDLGVLRGITGLQQGRGIELKPYASFTHRSDPQPGEKQGEFNPGFDLIWHLTPSLTSTFTINTDFADAEVDQRRVNLGRFSLFFPEKRAFFTQDAPLFSFAGINRDPLPFFSRTIGLAADGSKVDLLGGIKLTGRAGPWTIGLLDVQIDEQPGIDSQNLFVGRITHSVGAESSAGIIFTHGDPRSNDDNTLVGVDFNYVNSRFRDEAKSLSIRASAQGTRSDATNRQGGAGTLAISYPNDPYEFFWSYSRLGNDFEPALGFAPRTGVEKMHLWNRYRWFFEATPLQSLDVFLEGDWVTDLHRHRLDRETWTGLEGRTRPGDEFVLMQQDRSERLMVPFEISPGVVIPTGDHRWSA